MTIFQEGAVLDRPLLVKAEQEPDLSEQAFFESVSEDTMLEAVEKAANVNLRSQAAASCHQWVAGGDSDFDELGAVLFGMAGGEDDVELTDHQVGMFESLQEFATDFISQTTDVKETDLVLMSEDPESADRIFESLESALSSMDSDESIAEFSVRDSMLLEAKERVVRDGKLTWTNKKKKKYKMTAARKAALKQARSKSNSSAGKAARKKSMKLRKSNGM